MTLDPEGVVPFKSEGTTYRLFFGMRARKATEVHYDLPFFHALKSALPALSPDDLSDPKKVAEAGMNLKFGDTAKLFEFALGKYHPQMSEDDVDNLIDEIGIELTTELLGKAIAASLAGEDDGAAGANPPVASRKKKTGSRSLVNG